MANPVLQCPAFAGPAGPAFFFFCLSQLLSAASLRWRQNHFSLTWGWPLPPDSFTTAPHGSNEAGLGLRWCRSPTRCPKTHTGSHRGFFSFALSLLHFSPTGKSWPVPETVLSRFAGFVHKRPTLAQRGVFVLWLYLSPTRLSKPHTGPQVVIYRLVNG